MYINFPVLHNLNSYYITLFTAYITIWMSSPLKFYQHIILLWEFGSWRGEFHGRNWWRHEVLEDKAMAW